MSVSTRIAPAILALALAGGAVTFGTTSAFAAIATHSVSGTVKAVNTKSDKLTVTVKKASDSFTTSAMTTVTVAGKKSAVADLKVGEKVTVVYSVAGKKWDATAITSAKA